MEIQSEAMTDVSAFVLFIRKLLDRKCNEVPADGTKEELMEERWEKQSEAMTDVSVLVLFIGKYWIGNVIAVFTLKLLSRS